MAEDSQPTLTDFGGDGADDTDGGRETEAEIAEAVAGETGGGATVVDMSERRYPDADGTTTLAVTQVDYTIEGRGDDERPVLHVFGRDPDREPVHVRVHEFDPYFYAPLENFVTDAAAAERDPAEWTDDDIDPASDPVQQHDRLTGRSLTDADGEPFESIRGDRLLKITGQTPRDVGQLRDRFDHYEADILFPNRLLIDRDIRSGVRVPVRRDDDGDAGGSDGGGGDGSGSEVPPIDVHHAELEPVEMDVAPRVCTFDIEVNDRNGFPEDGEEPIVCLTSHDSYDDEYVVWLYTAPDGVEGPDDLNGYDPIEDDLDVEVRAFEREEAMLGEFTGYISKKDADCLTGWNFTDFDAPYLLDRIEELATPENNLDIDRLSRVNEVWRSDWQGPNVKGRVVFDLLYAYKRTQFTELDSYRLDAVGETELDVGKERYPGDIGDLWEDDPERLLEYNLRDVELCVELDRKQEIVPFWQEVASFVGCKLEDATTPGDAVDMYILHEVFGNFVLPSKGSVDAEDYEGGAVFDPITGVKENVSVLDLKCFSGDTDVATPDGIRNIRDMEIGDPVYTLNPETFECEVKPVVDTQSYENRYGELHHTSGNTYDFKVTENHRFLLSKTRGWDDLGPEDYEFAEYRDVPDAERFAFPNHEPMAGATRERFELVDEVEDGHAVVYAHDGLTSFRAAMPAGVESSLDWANGTSRLAATEKKTGKYLLPIETYREHRDVIDEHADEVFLKYDRGHAEVPTAFEMDDWLELVGWFVTEGSFIRETPGIVLHQQDDSGREAIRALLDRMNLNYSVDENRFNVSNRFLHDWFIENCGDGYAEKRLPEWVFELDADHLRVLLDTLIAGDGSQADSGLRKFWTKSDQLKEDITRLAVRCGEKPTVSKQSDGTWYVSIGKQGSMKKAQASVEDHNGQVHCITAKDNHVVLAGRNGHFQWVGQSLYPMSMVTINASPETKVGSEYDGNTYRAPNGTQFRAEPDGIIRTMVDDLLTEREEKKGLRNDHEPGTDQYEQYDRQQQAVKVIMNCFTSDTDVLTPDGVRNIRDLDVGDEVYSLDPDTMRMEVKPVVETQAYPDYRGDLVDIQTSKIDFRVTPNHRMLVRKDDANGITEEDWSFVEAGDLEEYCHYEMPYDWSFEHEGSLPDQIDLLEFSSNYAETDVTVADGGTLIAARHGSPNAERWVDTDDFLEFLAWYITEGSVYEAKTKNYRVKIAQEDEDYRGHISELTERLADYVYTEERSVSFSSRVWGDLLESICGDKSASKRIPEFVFSASKERKSEFLATLIAGDGDRQENSWRFTTKSQQLRDDILRLCAHLGKTASFNRDSDCWRIYVTEGGKNSFRLHRSGGRSTAENGVYCVSVEGNQTLMAGRNGKFQFCGNSLYGVLGWDRFRLYDKEMGAAVTATGREVIEYTSDIVEKNDRQIIYGDTDSVMVEFGGDIDKETAIEKSFELEETINASYDEFALEELDAAHHRFQIEFEKLYRRFFQAGKKKRYAGNIVWKEGKDVDDIDITGFEYKRSDIAPVTKRVQHRVIEMIVTGADHEDVRTYVHEEIDSFKAGNVDLDDIGIPGGIGKKLDAYDTATAQVRGAKYANLLLGTNFGRGSKPKRLYLENVDASFFERIEAEEGLDPHADPLYGEFKRDPDVICFEFADQVPEEFRIDYEKMLEKTLKGPIARILEALGISWQEVESGQEQTGLGSFM